jgi:hypothetical protein
MRLEKNCLPPVPVAQVPREPKQSGFIILMGMLMLVLGAAVWFGTASNIRSESMKIAVNEEHVNELYRLKDKMLTYAMFQPEIFRTHSGNYTALDQKDIPGPGYFPCPDSTGNDGVVDSPCGGSGASFVIGVVPKATSSRFFSFIDRPLDNSHFWYAVDTRFVTQNPDYYYDGAYKRFVPLNTASPVTASLTLDGVDDIVMVLFYSGGPVAGQNQSTADVANITSFLELENSNGDADFISVPTGLDRVNHTPFNDFVIPITRREWNGAMLSRVSMDADGNNVPDLCVDPAVYVDPAAPVDLSAPVGPDGTTVKLHWFNDCFSVGTVGTQFLTCDDNSASTDENLYGQGWRTVLGCPL